MTQVHKEATLNDKFNRKKTIEELRRIIVCHDQNTCCSILEAINELKDVYGVEALQVFKDIVMNTVLSQDFFVCREIIEAIQHIGGEEAIKFFRDIIKDHNNYYVRRRAVGALGRIGGEKVLEYLGNIVVNYYQYDETCCALMEALEHIYAEKALWVFEKIAIDSDINRDRGMKCVAVHMLGRIGGKKAKVILKNITKGHNASHVCREAVYTLECINEKNHSLNFLKFF